MDISACDSIVTNKRTGKMSDDNESNADELSLNAGQKFHDYEQLSTSVNTFCREHYHPFVIRTRSQRQVLYKCCHGIKQTSKCRGKRPNQRYYYKSCPAQINFYRGKNETWTLTKILLNHNHPIGKKEYCNYGKAKKINENDYDTATDLISSAKDEMIASGGNIIRMDQNSSTEFLIETEENDGVYTIIKEESFTDDFDCPSEILSYKVKLDTALAITKNIADILSNYGTQTFNKYIEELKLIENNARNGSSLFKHKSSELSTLKHEESKEQIWFSN